MLVLFDIDDTLLDDTGATRDAVAALHAHVSSSLQLAEFQQRWSHALEFHFGRYLAGEVCFQQQRRDRIRDALQQPLPDRDADALFEHYLRAYSASWRPFVDVVPCLANLRRRHTLGVVSNGNSKQQRGKLKQLGLLDAFSIVVVSEDIGIAKPASAIFHHAMRLASAAPADTFHIGDHPHTDALAACRAGARGVWLNRKELVTSAPVGVESITTLTELATLL